MPRDGSIQLPATGQQPAWLWPATGRVQSIGGLPRDPSGYQFTRVGGGWAVQANSAARPRCGSCAGPRLPVYFLADHAQSVTPVGAADAVAPSAAADALWLTSYPPGADMSRAAGTAREVSTGHAPAGPRLRLPAGYVIYRGTDRGLLLAPAGPSATATITLWNPVSYDNVGDDGALAMQLDVVSMAGAKTKVVPAMRVSSDALVGFGWPVGGDDLVAELNFIAKLQVASWHPDARRLAVAVVSPGPESAALIVG